MFCSNCGKEIDDKALFCPNCGNQVKKETVQRQTKKEIDYSAINLQYSNLKKSQWIAYLLWVVGGITGAQRFYSGNYIYCGIFLFLSLISLFSNDMYILFFFLWLIDLFILHISISSYNKQLLKWLEESQVNNTFVNIKSSGCLPVAAYTIVTGIMYWLFFTANVVVKLKNTVG